MTPPRPIRTAPIATATGEFERVDFDPQIFYCDKDNVTIPCEGGRSGQSTRRSWAKKIVEAVLNKYSLHHQVVIIHDICTKGIKAGIGVCLNMVKEPDLVRRQAMMVYKQIKAYFHLPAVYQRNSNQVQTFLRTVLPAMVEAAPPEDATSKKKQEHKENEKEFLKAMGLKRRGGMLANLKEAAKRRRELENCEDVKQAIVSPAFKGKSPCNKKNTAQNQASLVRWLDKCDLIIHSPDKRDMKQKRDHFTKERLLDVEGNYVLQRKY